MGAPNWSKTLDLDRAIANVRTEFPGDWHRDPWGWPELGFIEGDRDAVFRHCTGAGSFRVAQIDVPKENWGSRPAVVLDVLDRVTYQALVDRLSLDLIGDLHPSIFGWRLPPTQPRRGEYSHNDIQWANYRNHLSLLSASHDVALRSDIVSFFASIPLDRVQDAVADRAPKNAVAERLLGFLAGFALVPERSGLPQRSLASAVIANAMLRPLDDVLDNYASDLGGTWHFELLGKTEPTASRRSFARWMDDVWLFVDDPAVARRAQVELQFAAEGLGLHLNSAKTDVLEGDEVAEQSLEIEHSAVDSALKLDNSEPLEALIEKVLDDPARTSRTTLRFMSKRMRDNENYYRIDDLLSAAPRMPHGADALAMLFKEYYASPGLQEWFLEHAGSDWAAFEWATAQYCRMFTSARAPQKGTITFYAAALGNTSTSLPLLAASAQRMSNWDAGRARTIIHDVMRSTANPHARRVLALAALNAEESRGPVRRWLRTEPENALTLAMLEKFGFVAPKVVADYAG